MARRLSSWEAWVRVLCAIALLCIGLAHKPPVVFAASVPAGDVAEYILPDGTLPVLCLPGQDDDGKAHSHDFAPGSGCEACRLSASLLLPPPPATSGERIATPLVHVVPLRHEVAYRQLFPPNSAPRAPPFSSHTA